MQYSVTLSCTDESLSYQHRVKLVNLTKQRGSFGSELYVLTSVMFFCMQRLGDLMEGSVWTVFVETVDPGKRSFGIE